MINELTINMKIPDKILNAKWFQKWIREVPDVELDKSRLSVKMKLGVFLIFFSFVVGWGMPVLLGILAGAFGSLKMLIGAPACYFISWGIWSVGMYLTGKSNYDYAKYFLVQYINKNHPEIRNIQSEE